MIKVNKSSRFLPIFFVLTFLNLFMTSFSDEAFDVIIVGAGISGLSAGQELLKNAPDTKLLILEGRGRLGGRVFTDRESFGYAIDLGASWIHDSGRGNPISQIVKENKIEVKYSDYEWVNMYDGVSSDSVSDRLTKKIYRWFEKYITKVIAKGKLLTQDQSVLSVWNDTIKDEPIEPYEYSLLKMVFNTETEGEYGGKSDELSVKYFDAGEIQFDDEDYLFPDGYDQIINPLTQGVEIRKNVIVVGINSTSQDFVQVTTSEGQVMNCKKVLITVPLGVLKKNMIKFTPPLPIDKQEAISKQGFGSLNKIVLEFPSAVWPVSDFFVMVNDNGYEFIMNWKKISSRNVLFAFHVGPFGTSDEESVDLLMKGLRKCFPSLPNPTRFKVSHWDSDPFSFGSYSFNAIGLKFQETIQRLQSNINNRLFFAGEHTHKLFPSTVHGAFLSGQEAAKEILDSFKVEKK